MRPKGTSFSQLKFKYYILSFWELSRWDNKIWKNNMWSFACNFLNFFVLFAGPKTELYHLVLPSENSSLLELGYI